MLNPKRRSALRRSFITKTESGNDQYNYQRFSHGTRGARELIDVIQEETRVLSNYDTYLIERVLTLWEAGFSLDHIAEATELTQEEIIDLVEADNDYEDLLREKLRNINF